MIQMMDSKR